MPKIINAEEKRLEICALAYERLVEEGIVEFSLNKFIEELNMSKGQFYYYFKSKEKLIFETLKIKDIEFVEIIKENIAKKSNFLEKLVEYFALILNEEEKIFIDARKIMFESIHLYLHPKYKDEMKSCENTYINMYEIIEKIFDEEIEKGFLKEDSKKAIKVVLATIDGMYYHSLIIDDYNLKGTIMDYLIETTNQLKR
ncbi:TetR/AcrR family transcriptional regulator [Aliarcobacter butzleri]|uniref:TetR/AcrR family transcriptional regulator n=1 Tax=Aliarcobacter butzleri TaxID=28197 RepID=UPI001EDE928B|nr:TetR/AcrR family transcriptional regulator [Aliarcobacter butzleri]MCG3680493.1 TetR/AcrR family transcriptional regulator [Aliarcobacter butzleri]